jgi:hypothetical protein
MKICMFAVLVGMLLSCGVDEASTTDVSQDQEGLAGSNPFLCKGSCLVCTKRDPADKRKCLVYGRKATAVKICSGYTTPASALSDCLAAMTGCLNVQASVGSFSCP